MPELLWIQKGQECNLFVVTIWSSVIVRTNVNYATVELPLPLLQRSFSISLSLSNCSVKLIHSGQAEMDIETFVWETSKDHIRVEGFQPNTEIEAGKKYDVTSTMDGVIIKLCVVV